MQHAGLVPIDNAHQLGDALQSEPHTFETAPIQRVSFRVQKGAPTCTNSKCWFAGRDCPPEQELYLSRSSRLSTAAATLQQGRGS